MSSIRDHSAVLVAVIEAIFHDPCPRGFALNLSKAEMLTALVKTKCINPADLPEPGAGCPVEAVLPDSAARSCRAMGVEWIRQLVRFIRADLLTLPDIGDRYEGRRPTRSRPSLPSVACCLWTATRRCGV